MPDKQQASYTLSISPAQLKQEYRLHNPDGAFFDSKNMRLAGDTMKNFTVKDGGDTWDLFRKNSVHSINNQSNNLKHEGYVSSFSKNNYSHLGAVKSHLYNNETSHFNRYMQTINSYIGKSLINKNSVLLQTNNTAKYAFDASNKKPFSGLNQLYMQQIIKDKQYSSRLFYCRNNPSNVIKNNTGAVLCRKNAEGVSYDIYFNADQLKTFDNIHLTDIRVNTKTEPYQFNFTQKEIQDFAINLHSYYASVYSGAFYNPMPCMSDSEKYGQAILENTFPLTAVTYAASKSASSLKQTPNNHINTINTAKQRRTV